MPSITFDIDTRAVDSAMLQAASAAGVEATKGIRAAAKDVALPIVRQAVAHKLPGKTTAGATAKGAYVQQTHPGAAIDEFGGVRRDVIVPKNAKALSTPAGPRAKVSGPRVYKKTLVLTHAAQRAREPMEAPTKKALLDAYRKAGFEVS